MNTLNAIVTRIERGDGVLLVHAECEAQSFVAQMIDHIVPAKVSPGDAITLTFQESEVALATHLNGEISLSNRHTATIECIESGALLARISLRFGRHLLCSLITQTSVNRMELKAGDTVSWLVKANEMLIDQTEAQQ